MEIVLVLADNRRELFETNKGIPVVPYVQICSDGCSCPREEKVDFLFLSSASRTLTFAQEHRPWLLPRRTL